MPVYQSGSTYNAKCNSCGTRIGTSSVDDWDEFLDWVDENYTDGNVPKIHNAAVCDKESCKEKLSK